MVVSMSSAQILRLRLRCDRTAPRLARKALTRLEEIRPVHDDALLVASELATGAVLESGVGSGKQIELLAELVPDGLRIAVSNLTAGPERAPTEGGSEKPVGGGFRIVRALARRWGRDRTDGEQIWAVLAM